MPNRYFEDFQVGDVLPLGERTLSRAEIVAFGAEFDPQPFHLDEQAPATELVGGLIASGWHVGAIFMRLVCDAFILDSASLGSPGIETLKWQRPVRPGDTISGTSTVVEARRSQSKPDRGIVRFRHEIRNQAGEVVMWMENPIFFRAREGGRS